MNIKPYNELTKKEKLIIKYENKLSDFIDMLNLDLMELIDSDWEKSTGYFFPKEVLNISETQISYIAFYLLYYNL